MGIYDENAPDDIYIDFSDEWLDEVIKRMEKDSEE